MSLNPAIRSAAALLLMLAGCRGADLASPPSASSASPASVVAAAVDSAGLHSASSANQSNVSSQTNQSSHAVPVRCAPHLPNVGANLFGPRGGTLSVGNSELIIPPGALKDTVTITATALGDGSSTVRFAPHGLQFRHPAVLVLSGEGCALPGYGNASIVYVGSSGQVLETIPAIYFPRWKLVGAPINHFSGYAIAF